MPGKRNQTVIASPDFRGEVQLSATNVREWCVASFEEAAASLLDEWNGGIIGLAGISLSSDNRVIENADFLLQGAILEDDDRQKVSANKFWTLPTKTSLVFRDLDASAFVFEQNLVSNYVSHTALEYDFLDKDGTPLSPESLEAVGISGFCIRAFVVPFQANWANLHVLLYPWELDKLREDYPLYSDPKFPGVQAFKLKFPLGPPAMLKWGHPINPAVLPGAPVDDHHAFPSGADFARAIAALFRAAVQPDTKSNSTSLAKRFAHMVENDHDPSTLNSPQLELIWPAGPPRPTAQGWC